MNAQARRRKYRRANGLCIDCGKPQYKYTTRCANCLDKDRLGRKRYYYRHRERLIAEDKLRKQARRDRGDCTHCGTPLDADADGPHPQCSNCRERLYREVI